jgi:hypothetical protein
MHRVIDELDVKGSGLIVSDLPGGEELVKKWAYWVKINLLPIVGSGRDSEMWGLPR